MKVLIKETNAIEELTLTDPKTGCQWESDFIGTGTNDDFLPVNSLDDDVAEKYYDTLPSFGNVSYIVSQATYDWWKKACSDWQEADYLMTVLKNDGVIDSDTILEIEDGCGGNDLDSQSSLRLAAYKAIKDAQKKNLAQSMASLRVASTHVCALSSCGREFEGISTGKYCSGKCKQKEYRKRRDNA